MKFKLSYTSNKNERIDSYLADELLDFSRSQIQKAIENKNIFVNGNTIKPNYKLKENDLIIGSITTVNKEVKLFSQKGDLDIIFEDENLIILSKPAGLVVHPGSGNSKNTLVNYLIKYYPPIINAVDEGSALTSARPGIVHRLDKDTSGIIVVAKNKAALSSISKQIKNRKVKKLYLGLCLGWPKSDSGTLINFIGRDSKNRQKMADVGEDKGKEAISKYKVLKHLNNLNCKYSLIEFNIKTGRTHQIRLQSKLAGFPVLGDKTYNTRESIETSKIFGIERQMLHAKSIDLFLPGDTKISHFEAPVPNDIAGFIK